MIDAEREAIVRELARRKVPVFNDGMGQLECVLCFPARRWLSITEALMPSNPANHAATCVWRRAREMYPRHERP